MNRFTKYGVCLLVLLVLIACDSSEEDMEVSAYRPVVPSHFPDIAYPEGNEWTPERWHLGKKLFFDTELSDDGSVSCASCHQPRLAFSDDRALSIGSGGLEGRSNAPGLGNVAYHPYFTRAGGVPTLEMQVLVPIQEHDEFNTNIVLIAEKLNQDPEYRRMSERAYGRSMDPYVITRALANFERSFISGGSPYDEFIKGESSVLSSSEKRGMALFFSKELACSKCHGGFDFTDYSFRNNGLYTSYKSEGRRRLTGEMADDAMFKVPSLRNVGMTAPYMHDGSMSTLDEVIEHYDSGGNPHHNKSELVRPLGLTDEEKRDLKSFLLSLTDESFINNPYFN